MPERDSKQRVRLGRRGEAIARQHLERQGYTILQTNYRRPEGEIDLVARDGEETVFVEVRTRLGSAFGTPEESVTPTKKERLLAMAQRYMAEHGGDTWWVDVVAIQLDRTGRLSRLQHHRHAIWQE